MVNKRRIFIVVCIILYCFVFFSCTQVKNDFETEMSKADVSSSESVNTEEATVAEGTETMIGTFENKYGDYIFYRDRLRNTFDKLINKKELKVLYYGGSVTYGVGATDSERTSWRGLLGEWLSESFPDAKITNLNSSISGTGSRLGLFRIENDVIPYNPDLIFIEYSINDFYLKEKASEIKSDNETLIRRLYEMNPDIDIVYIFTGNQTTANQQDILHFAAAAQDEICNHYGINSIAVSRALTDRMSDKSSPKCDEWLKYYQDAVHPIDAGYSAYFEVIREFFIHEYALYNGENTSAKMIPNAKTSVMNNYRLVCGNDMAEYVSGDWKYNNRIQPVSSGLAVYNGAYTANAVGAELEVKFTGKGISLFFAGSGISNLQYSVDSPGWKSVESDGNRPLNLLYDEDGEPTEHTVKIRYKVGTSSFDLKIVGLLIWNN